MLFNSLSFVVFLAIVLTLFWRSRHSAQNWILLVASCFFYGYWDWRFLGLLFLTSTIDYAVAIGIENAGEDRRRAKRLLLLSLFSNLGILGFFKYSNFFLDTVANGLQRLGFHAPHHLLEVVLPVGISFYTFQAMAYTIDVYRGHTPACRTPRDFFCFITFFPQLVAGPIERAGEMMPQFVQPRKVTREDIAEGFYLILWGFAKKTVVADNLAQKVDRIFSQGHFTTTDVIIGTLGFAFQIYADFSGYTDIARGVARWLGFRLMLNFDHPYFAANPQEFWRRWHISLSTWLREYLYIPLGGNRLGGVRTYVNLMITMLLGGLWHGASWNFIAWGAYQGALLAAHRYYTGSIKPQLPEVKTGVLRGALSVLSVAAMFVATLYGWLLFRARDVATLEGVHTALTHFSLSADLLPRLKPLLPYLGLVLAVDAVTFFTKDAYYLARRNFWLTTLFYVFLIYLILILGVAGGQSFIYFAF